MYLLNCKNFKNSITFQKIKKEEELPNVFDEAGIMMIPKQNKANKSWKENYRWKFFIRTM